MNEENQDWLNETFELVNKINVSDSDKIQIMSFINSIKNINTETENEKINTEYGE